MTPERERLCLVDALKRKREEYGWTADTLEDWQVAERLRDIWSLEQTLAAYDAAHPEEAK